MNRCVGKPPAGAEEEDSSEEPAEQEACGDAVLLPFDGPRQRYEREPGRPPPFELRKSEDEQSGSEDREQRIFPCRQVSSQNREFHCRSLARRARSK